VPKLWGFYRLFLVPEGPSRFSFGGISRQKKKIFFSASSVFSTRDHLRLSYELFFQAIPAPTSP
jgi:hypothetical protein